jgi:predicted DNA-binding protein YlxM (UPF0122 family)
MEHSQNETAGSMAELAHADAYLAALPRKVRLALLYGVYGPLLNENRRRVLSMWIDEDYSLAEIAQEVSISRQGVYDSIKRSEQILHRSEQQLCVVRRMLAQEMLMRRCEEAPQADCAGCMHQTFAAIRRLWEENPWPLKD